MLTISRARLRQFRTVCRQAGLRASRHRDPRVTFTATAESLWLRAGNDQVAIAHEIRETFPPGEFSLPLSVVAQCESRRALPVTFDRDAAGQITAHWSDRNIPQQVQYQPTDALPTREFPPLPDRSESNEPKLLAALRDAAATTDDQALRYALHCMQLRGADGSIATTDTRQLLVQRGFRFPWTEPLLVPANPVFACAELPRDTPVAVGQAGDWLSFALGPWHVGLKLERERKFPPIDNALPAAAAATTHLTVSSADADFVLDCLARLPGHADEPATVTLDLNGHVALRAKSAGESRVTEVVLTNSQYRGEPLRLATDRNFLGRAIRLGLREFDLYSSGAPIRACDGRRTYVWALLDPEGALAPTDDMQCFASPVNGGSSPAVSADDPAPITRPPAKHSPRTSSRSSRVTMPDKNTPSTTTATAANTDPPHAVKTPRSPSSDKLPHDKSESPLAQALGLRSALRATLAQTDRLILSLKRQKQQSRLVASTLRSLKQLQDVA